MFLSSYLAYEHEMDQHTGWEVNAKWVLVLPVEGDWRMPCRLHFSAAVKAGSVTWTDTISWRQRHTPTAGLEIVSPVGAGEDYSSHYYAKLWLPNANINLYFHSKAQWFLANIPIVLGWLSLSSPLVPAAWCLQIAQCQVWLVLQAVYYLSSVLVC